MKKFLNEFKEFALRGNVVDLAVGVIIGTAFKSIVDSLVADIISPLLGLVVRADFKELTANIAGVPINYGNFITMVINFILMALIIFVLVKVINKLSGLTAHTEKSVASQICPYCKIEIEIDATRCPHCTSQLEPTTSGS